jgi:hypothetical protein
MRKLRNVINEALKEDDIKKLKAQLPAVMKQLAKDYDGECKKYYNDYYADIEINFGTWGPKWIELNERETELLGEHKYDPDKSCWAIGVSLIDPKSKSASKLKSGDVFKIKNLNLKYAGCIPITDDGQEHNYYEFIIYTDPIEPESIPELGKLKKVLNGFDEISHNNNTDAIGQQLNPGDVVLFIPNQTDFKTKAWMEIGVIKDIKTMIIVYTRSRHSQNVGGSRELNTMTCWPGQCIKLTQDMEKLLDI